MSADIDPRVADALPVAAALVCAVADDDQPAVHALLTAATREELYALTVVLAANVSCDTALTVPDPDADDVSALVLAAAAGRWHTTVTELTVGSSRRRSVLDARLAAAYALNQAGWSHGAIATRMRRDRSSVSSGIARARTSRPDLVRWANDLISRYTALTAEPAA